MNDHKEAAKNLRTQAVALLEQAYVLDGLQPYLVTNLTDGETYVGWYFRRPYEKQIAELMNLDEKQYAKISTLVEGTVSLSDMCGGEF